MDKTTSSLSNQVFGPSRRVETGVRSQAEGIIERLQVYVWPKNITDEEKMCVLGYLPAYGRSIEESPSDWATWLYSYIVLCFPEMRGAIDNVGTREYEFVTLPKSFIDSLVALAAAAETFDDASGEGTQYNGLALSIVSPPGFPSISTSNDPFPPDYSAGRVVPVIYGYCGLLIYLAGKKINEKNVTSITEKRPSNIIATYSLDDFSSFCLIGDGKMGSTAHAYVNQAWVTYAAARQGIIKEVAAFSHGATLPQRVVYTLSKMIEYAGMQPAAFIHKFLLAMPEATEFSCLKSSLNAYAISLREVAAAPSHIQPYYKVIYGDLTRAFHRNHLLVLSACAIAYERYTAPSMANFNLGEGAVSAVTMYDAEATRKGHPTLQELTFVDEQEVE
jgi:hypothetical protein